MKKIIDLGNEELRKKVKKAFKEKLVLITKHSNILEKSLLTQKEEFSKKVNKLKQNIKDVNYFFNKGQSLKVIKKINYNKQGHFLKEYKTPYKTRTEQKNM